MSNTDQQEKPDQLRVLVLATTFPRWEGDSEPRFILDLTKPLARSVCLWLLAPHAPGARFFEEMDGVRVIRFPYFFPAGLERLCYDGGILPKLKASFLARIQLPFFLISQFFHIWRTTRKFRINFIHCHWIIPQGFFCALLNRWLGIPYMLTAHGGDVFSFKSSPIIQKLSRFALQHSRLCAANTQATRTAVEDIYDRVVTRAIPMGVDTNLFHPDRYDETLKSTLNISGLFLLGVGRFAEKKGFKYLIDAMPIVIQRHPGVKLILVGFGPEELALKRQVETLRLSDSVIFPGAKSGVELASHFATADIFIGPSIVASSGDTEGQGVVFAEALSSKTAVIASDVGGIAEMIKDGVTGLIVPQKNSTAIAESILRLHQDPSLRNRLAENGRRLAVEKYSWETIAAQYLEVYKQAASSNIRK